MASVRRLAAILAADVAGYSSLMGADEEGTHERLKAHLVDLVNPKIAEHRGRIVKNTGDGFLAEFQSVVDGVRCAVEIQRGMAEREQEVTDEWRIRFRIGINLGDVIVEEHDIFGDGVNVAARLEALAKPGGICISRVVRDQIRDKLPYSFKDMGEQGVKNIARPVRVFAMLLDGVVGVPEVNVSSTASTSPPLAAPHLSIVVLPFTNLSNDPEQQYFADGITEDLTTDLSRIAGMFVISRNTAFTYRNKPIDTKQIGRELGVRYVLEGSVRRSISQVRVNTQLIDAETDAHLWADRFDRETGELFALQNEVTSRIAIALNLELVGAEAARYSAHPQAVDYILLGRNALELKPPSHENFAEAIGFFERALVLEPRSVEASSLLASSLAGRVLDGMSHSVAADLDRAAALVRRALGVSRRSPLAHFANGEILRAQGRPEEATPEYETAIAFNRNWVEAITALGWCKFFGGHVDEAIPLHEEAIRLSPRDPLIGDSYFRIGRVHLAQSRTEEAVAWLEKARRVFPGHPLVHAHLASAYALLGAAEDATVELSEARKHSGDDRYSSMARLMTLGYWGVPKVRELIEATYFVGLRKAGMPEE
jgi:adenylate cyclase